MAIQNVYFRGESIPNQQVITPQQTKEVTTNPIQKTKPDLISQDGANALRAYTLQNNINFSANIKEKVGTSKDYIENLKAKGLKEGTDFIVEKDEYCTEVHVRQGNSTVKDMVWYKEDTGEIFDCYRTHYRSQNNPIEGITTCIDANGKFRYRTKTYEKNPIKNDEINADLKPDNYVEYLKQNNMKYTIDYQWQDDDKFSQIFCVYNPQTDSMTKVVFDRDLAKDDILGIHKEIYNSNNESQKTVHYYHNSTQITDFSDK